MRIWGHKNQTNDLKEAKENYRVKGTQDLGNNSLWVCEYEQPFSHLTIENID